MVQSGVNGRLLHRNSSAEEFAAMIAKLWADSEAYAALRRSSRAHFEQRLNWNAWAADFDQALLCVRL